MGLIDPRDLGAPGRREFDTSGRRHAGSARSRGVSTVADATIALLLVSAAVAILAGVAGDSGPSHRPERAPQTAQTVTATTVPVTYSLDPGDGACTDADDPPDPITRTTHGSVGELLGDAAVTGAALDGSRLIAGGGNYTDAVAAAAAGTLPATGRTRVAATWRPYDGAVVGGTSTVGPAPPPDADVSVATLSVPARIDGVGDHRLAAAYDAGGYDRAARLVARAAVDGLLAPAETQPALEARGPTRALAVSRYERFGSAVGVAFGPASGALARSTADAASANAQLVDALAPRLAADMERALSPRVDDGADLAAAVSVEDVTVTVSTWDR